MFEKVYVKKKPDLRFRTGFMFGLGFTIAAYLISSLLNIVEYIWILIEVSSKTTGV